MKKILNPTNMLIIGLILGIVSRLLDIYTKKLRQCVFTNGHMDIIGSINFY